MFRFIWCSHEILWLDEIRPSRMVLRGLTKKGDYLCEAIRKEQIRHYKGICASHRHEWGIVFDDCLVKQIDKSPLMTGEGKKGNTNCQKKTRRDGGRNAAELSCFPVRIYLINIAVQLFLCFTVCRETSFRRWCPLVFTRHHSLALRKHY